MRRLHPVGRLEVPVDHGAVRRPDGRLDAWSVHALPGGRHVVRVEDVDGALWHLSLDDAGRPERLQARWREDGRGLEVTFTFFEDEVLIWRRGAEPASEALAVPPGSRLLWPPVAGRDWCLTGVAADGPEAVPAIQLLRRPASEGGLTARSVELAASRADEIVTLIAPGLPDARMTLDADGRLRAWRDGDILFERVAGDAR